MIDLPDQLTTDRLVIRPFQPDDREAYVAFMTDPRATRYLLFTDAQKTEEGARLLVEAIMASYTSDEPVFAYAIALKDGGFIGSCGLSSLPGEGVYECYYSLLPAYWGHGYATEATRALLAYCFAQGVWEVRAYMSPDHPASAGVAERVGMTDRGLRQHPTFDHEGRLYAITNPLNAP